MAKTTDGKRGIENPRAFKKDNEFILQGQLVNATYIYERLKRTHYPITMRAYTTDIPKNTIVTEFGKLVDLINGDVWLKRAALTIDYDTNRIVFDNGCIVYFSA